MTTPGPLDAIAQDFHDATGAPPTGGLPLIRWEDGELTRVVNEAEAALIASPDAMLFQRGSLLVRVVRNAAMSSRDFCRPDAGGLSLVAVDKFFLTEAMGRAAWFQKWDGRIRDYRRCDVPTKVPETYLSRSGHWRLPKLLSVIGAPTLRPDGSVLQTHGYDEVTATWYEPSGIAFKPVPDKPTKKQVDAALETLVSVLDTVPFVSTVDTSVMLSMMLTSLVRRSLPSAPLGAFSAPVAGSGKTLLADCIGILATGVRPPAQVFPNKDEEAEKVVLTLLMAGESLVLFDNLSRPLEGDWLCSVLTSETYQGRMLGHNEKATVPTNTLFLATGNHLTIKGDLRRRSLLCQIDAKTESPHQRTFSRDLKEIFHERRAELVVAALTLMRGYLTAREPADVFRPWGSFEHWSRMCREPLMWRGLSDPCQSYEVTSRSDPERLEHQQVVAGWDAVFGASPTSAREAIAGCASHADFEAVLRDVAADRAGGLSARRLGRWLSTHVGRPIDGHVIENAGVYQGVLRFKVVAHGK